MVQPRNCTSYPSQPPEQKQGTPCLGSVHRSRSRNMLYMVELFGLDLIANQGLSKLRLNFMWRLCANRCSFCAVVSSRPLGPVGTVAPHDHDHSPSQLQQELLFPRHTRSWARMRRPQLSLPQLLQEPSAFAP